VKNYQRRKTCRALGKQKLGETYPRNRARRFGPAGPVRKLVQQKRGNCQLAKKRSKKDGDGVVVNHKGGVKEKINLQDLRRRYNQGPHVGSRATRLEEKGRSIIADSRDLIGRDQRSTFQPSSTISRRSKPSGSNRPVVGEVRSCRSRNKKK